jgi:hypothetical protein
MVVIKAFFALILLAVVFAIVIAVTCGPAIAYFVWGWKVALGWFFVTSGSVSLAALLKTFATDNND